MPQGADDTWKSRPASLPGEALADELNTRRSHSAWDTFVGTEIRGILTTDVTPCGPESTADLVNC